MSTESGPTTRRLRLWLARSSGRVGPATGARALFDWSARPLMEILGFQVRHIRTVDLPDPDRCIAATLGAGVGGTTMLLVIPFGESPWAYWRRAVRHGLRTEAEWSLIFNGRTLQVTDARRTYARRCLDVDLTLAAGDDDACRVFAALVGANAFAHPWTGEGTSWFDAAVRESDLHAARVSASLQVGVRRAMLTLTDAFARSQRQRDRPPDVLLDHALTIVYRVLFLLFAEARGLVPVWHPVYRDAYTLASLHPALDGRESPQGLWEALQAIARLAHQGCHAGDLRVTPFNGRLFAPRRVPLAETASMDDEAVRQALSSLMLTPDDAGGRHRIAYADLGVEQLGAVYERVLEYEPEYDEAAGGSSRRPAQRGAASSPLQAGRIRLVARASRRQATGTFYTPRSLTDFLVRRTLHPLVADKRAERILDLRLVDPAMGSGAFLVSACRYLAAAYERALIRDGVHAAHDIDDRDRAGFRRLVAQRCLFGVDLNPVAVQLARLSVWLVTLAADRPLTFLDHRFRTGDSLVGASLDDPRRWPGTRRRARGSDSQLALFDREEVEGFVRSLVGDRLALTLPADDSIAVVREKESRLERLESQQSALLRWKALADLWCACWFWEPGPSPGRQVYMALFDFLRTGATALRRNAAVRLAASAREIAGRQRFFHWALEFPEVFYDEHGRPRDHGGFDAVLGNPPWDMVRGDTGLGADRERARAIAARLTRFVHASGVYRAQGSGHPNRYQLFLERALTLVRPGGRLGLVLPIGLALDHGSASLRRRLIERCAIDAFVTFENRESIFPVHRSVRFLLLTATTGESTTRLRCRFGERSPDVLDTLPDDPADEDCARLVELTPAWLQRTSGDALTIPELRTRDDLEIVDALVSSFPGLGTSMGWRARFGRELNATDDRSHFRPRSPSSRELLPVVDGKHLRPFGVAADASARGIEPATAARLLERARTFGRPRLAYRDVAGAGNRLTLIAAVVAADLVTTHTVFCLKSDLDLATQDFLCGMLNSYVANYFVRQRVSTHVTVAVIERLPVPRPAPSVPSFQQMVRLARWLSSSDPAAPAWPDTHARLQALAASLYDLTAAQYTHVLSTFPLVPADERARAAAAFDDLQHGERACSSLLGTPPHHDGLP